MWVFSRLLLELLLQRSPEVTSESVGESTTREDLKEDGDSLQKSPEVICQENGDTSTTTQPPAPVETAADPFSVGTA